MKIVVPLSALPQIIRSIARDRITAQVQLNFTEGTLAGGIGWKSEAALPELRESKIPGLDRMLKKH